MDKMAVGPVVRERCTRRLARNARKNAKSLSSRAATVQYIAKSVFRSAKAKAVKSNNKLSIIHPVRKKCCAGVRNVYL